MAEESFKRKLTTMFSADVAGYSRLMAKDEAGTVKTLKAYREIMTELIKQHRGRVVDSPGDNVLAEFTSVVDAVQCAVSVQKELQARNAELPEDRRMEFRIGVNLGDVIEEEDRIYGDGVNIAARLEALADPGGICISKTAFDHIETKLPLGYEYLGEQTVKNIAKPVGAYRVLMEPRVTVAAAGEEKKAWPVRRKAILAGAGVVLIAIIGWVVWNVYFRPSVDPASVEKMAYPLPDKPSIAVLPFVNKSGDPGQDYFSDGLTEEIITALSQIQNMFVIARNSTNAYKGKDVEIKQVAEELGVRYVVEGSVRMAEDRVRITAQLIDAITGKYLWAERWDRDLADIFALQDEITKKIITSLDVTLLKGEDARRLAQSTDNLEAYLKFLEGTKMHQQHTKDTNLRGRQMLEEAIALDPNFLGAYIILGITHLLDAAYGWAESFDESIKAAEELAHKALALDDSRSGVYNLLGGVSLLRLEYEKAVALYRKAIALSPNSAAIHAWLGIALLQVEGKAEESIKELKIARRLDPFPPDWILNYSAVAYRVNGEYEKAIEILQKVIKRSPDYWLSHFELAANYGLLGREEEAKAAAAEVLRIDPNFTIEKLFDYEFRDEADRERTIEVLLKAGLKFN